MGLMDETEMAMQKIDAARAAAGKRIAAEAIEVEFVRADQVPIESITWLWDGYLAAGKLHIVAGALHEFIEEPGMTGPMVAEIALFLDRLLLSPDRWAKGTADHNLFAQGPEKVMALMQQLLAQG